MPLFSHVASLLLAGSLLLACSGRAPVSSAGNSPAGQNPTGAGATVTTDADGNTLQNYSFTPKVGQGFTITLPGHGTQGYQWHLVAGYNAQVVTTSGTSHLGALPANAGIGQSAPEIFDFTAAAPGQTKLAFALYRSWEGPDRAGETRTFNVTVQ